MAKENGKKGVITISVVAAFVFTAVILFLSLSDFFGGDTKPSSAPKNTEQTGLQSDATPGENNKEVKLEISPEEVHGTYFEEHDGWYYDFAYSPSNGFHGTYTARYDASHPSVSANPEKDYSEQGMWILENGEIKLFINGSYAKSLWSCGDYVIDSRNYFVGYVPQDGEDFQSAFICKAALSGDTQILRFYSDGKMIMEIVPDDGMADKSSDSSAQPDAEDYRVFVGDYVVEDGKITIKFIDKSEKVFYIVDDGIAGWVYTKKSN